MKTCLRRGAFLLTMLLPPSSHAVDLAGGDDFDDGSKDPAKWGSDNAFGLNPGTITEANGRIHFSSSSTDSTYLNRPWIANIGSYVTDWAVQLDTVVPSDSGDGNGIGISLEVWNSANPNAFVSVLHENFLRTPTCTSSGALTLETFFEAGMVDGGNTSGAVRIHFNSQAKILTTYFDADGPANGYQWTQVSAYGISGSGGSTDNGDWGMSGSSSFSVGISGNSSGFAAPIGEAYGDNFQASTRTLPAPLSESLMGADDFNDSSMDVEKWGIDQRFESGLAVMEETNGRLEFSSSSTEFSYLGRKWDANFGAYDSDWEVQLDTRIPPDSGELAILSIGLEVWKTSDNRRYVGVQHENAGQSPSGFSYGGVDDELFFDSSTVEEGVTTGAVRIHFDSHSKILTTYFDSDGTLNGYQWTQVSSYGIAGSGGITDRADWGMTDADSFTIVVTGSSTGVAAPAGIAFGDNFRVTSRRSPARCVQALAGDDSFDDNASDPNKWGDDQRFGIGTAMMMETNGRLEYTSSTAEGSFVGRPWKLNFGTYNADWEARVDTGIPSDSGELGNVAIGLEAWNASNSEMFVGIQHDNIPRAPQFLGYGAAAAEDLFATQASPTSSTSGSLRIRFDSELKVLTLSYDPDGSSNGEQWGFLASYGIAGSGGVTDNRNWGMSGLDTFTIAVTGSSSGFVVPSGIAYADHFAASSTAPERLPSTVVFSGPKSGTIAVPTVFGRTYRLFRSEGLICRDSTELELAGTGAELTLPFDDSLQSDSRGFFWVEEFKEVSTPP